MNYNDVTQYSYYDIEVFSNYLLIQCLKPDGSWITLENPTFGELSEFMNLSNLVGFNNHNYDDVVLAALYYHHISEESKPSDPVNLDYAKEINDQIIGGEELNLVYHKTRLFHRTFDVMKYMKSDLGYATLGSLKTFENAIGMAIKESPVDFSKPLPDEQKEPVRGYCKHDVVATKRFHELLIDRKTVESVEWVRSMVANELNVQEETLWYKSANSLVIKLFEPELGQFDSKKYNRQDFFDFLAKWDSPYLQSEPMRSIKQVLIDSSDYKAIGYEPLIEEFAESFNLIRKGKSKRWSSEDDKLTAEITTTSFNITYDGFVFGLGGIHSHQGELVARNVHDADVDSLHPSTMIMIKALGAATPKFEKIVARRLEAKRNGDSAVANALKIVINSIYGLCRSATSGAFLYGATIGLDVCIAGELLIYVLAKEIQSVQGHLIQTNTDGIMYTAETETIASFCQMKILEIEWQTGYNFSSETFAKYFAKDVNNYFTADAENNLITTKGALFNKKPFGNNQVVGQFIMDYLLEKPTSFKAYLKENPELLLCRAKVNRSFRLIEAHEVEMPRYSEKTGKQLKHPELVHYDIEEIGQQVRGYPVKDPSFKMVRKLNLKTNKTGLVSNVADRLSDSIPNADQLDEQYFLDLILKNIEKIRPVSTTEQLDIVNIACGNN